jgi:hypothetical protein
MWWGLGSASGCIVEYIGNVVHMSGTLSQRTRAHQYLDWLFLQLAGPVHVDQSTRTDMCVVEVPTSCVGYVTGNRRETLGKMEEEWGVLMFFLDSYKDDPERHKRTMEKLAIFGPKRNRRGAELKVTHSDFGWEIARLFRLPPISLTRLVARTYTCTAKAWDCPSGPFSVAPCQALNRPIRDFLHRCR